ncbi:hypothetical protein M378DRAFT_759767 [Amanita muscaria Koide BX008]|uniref:Uncharacterized protein n=1 Tax=Amanita muscaria (strain Koide BX008) TaxID=946122 RepID=A0A0C2WLJ8_AMAMK|nr:hypothetical protein M378DRAFT_759767 [Amanita muscaria Koide BX008]
MSTIEVLLCTVKYILGESKRFPHQTITRIPPGVDDSHLPAFPASPSMPVGPRGERENVDPSLIGQTACISQPSKSVLGESTIQYRLQK